MSWDLSREDYDNHQIVREGFDGGWGQFSGYTVVVKGDLSAIVYSDHCSCYGTWSGNEIDGGRVVWTGTKDELLEMARRKADPDMPEREIAGVDFDAKYLRDAYEAVLKWNRDSHQ